MLWAILMHPIMLLCRVQMIEEHMQVMLEEFDGHITPGVTQHGVARGSNECRLYCTAPCAEMNTVHKVLSTCSCSRTPRMHCH